MDEKIEAIKNKILERLPSRQLQYMPSGGLHQFRIEGAEPIHWLYFSDVLVADSGVGALIDLTNEVLKTLDRAQTSKGLFLSRHGVREVDQHFAKSD